MKKYLHFSLAVLIMSSAIAEFVSGAGNMLGKQSYAELDKHAWDVRNKVWDDLKFLGGEMGSKISDVKCPHGPSTQRNPLLTKLSNTISSIMRGANRFVDVLAKTQNDKWVELSVYWFYGSWACWLC